MACCKCCCEAGANPGVCCGLPGSRDCCRTPKTCCQNRLCCEEGETCCGIPGSPVCCGAGTSCCGLGCCPDGQVCCEGNCCAPGECCVGGVCAACDCDPPCSTANCEVCTEVSAGVFDCVTSCTGGQVCCGGVCQECCGDSDCPEGESCYEGSCGPTCTPPCDLCSDCVDGDCVSSCAGGENCCNGVCQTEPCGFTCGFCARWVASSDPDCPFTSDCPAVQDNCTYSCDTVSPCGCNPSPYTYVGSCGGLYFRDVVPAEYHSCSCASLTTVCQTYECNGVGEPGFCTCRKCKYYTAYRDFVHIFNIESCQWEQLLELPGQIIDSPCSEAGEGCECPPGHTCTPPDCGSFPGCECNEFP
jgi:hypothetical protein